MKTSYKAIWLITGLLAITACKKDVKEVPLVPEKNKYVYAGDQKGIMYAFNALTGTQVWSYATGLGGRTRPVTDRNHARNTSHKTLDGTELYYSPAISGSNLVFPTENKRLFNLNTETGAVNWNVEMPDWTPYGDGAPIINNNVVYMGGDSHLMGFNLTTGAVVLNVDLGESVNTVNYSNGILVAATCWGHLFGVDPVSGNKLWEYLSPDGECYHSNPGIGNNVIYIATNGGYVSAVNLLTGTEIWKSDFGSELDDACLLFLNDMVYTASPYGNTVFALNASNGSVAQTYDMPGGKEFPWGCGVTIDKGIAYVASIDGTVYAVDVAASSIKWERDLECMEVTGSVTVANGYLYIGGDSKLYALDMNTGAIVWQQSLTDFVYASPVVLSDRGMMYRATNSGMVK